MNIILIGVLISIAIIAILYRVTRLERLRYKRLQQNKKLSDKNQRIINHDFIAENDATDQHVQIRINAYKNIRILADIAKIEMANNLCLIQVNAKLDQAQIAFQIALTPFDSKFYKSKGFERLKSEGMLLFETTKETLNILSIQIKEYEQQIIESADDIIRVVFQTIACTYDSKIDQYTFEVKSDGMRSCPIVNFNPDSLKLKMEFDPQLIPFYAALLKEKDPHI